MTEQNNASEERIQQEMETFKEWLKEYWEWDPREVMERYKFIRSKLHLSLEQLNGIMDDMPLRVGDEYSQFMYHLCIFLKSLELHKEGQEQQHDEPI